MNLKRSIFNEFPEVFDVVEVIDYTDLTEKQLEFLKSRETFTIYNIVDKNGSNFADIGYAIPLRLSRFKTIIPEIKNYKNKILFISFDMKIDTYGEEDTSNMFRESKTTRELFEKLINEKIKNTLIEFINYSDIYRFQNDYLYNDRKLTDYDFIFFGFISNNTTLSKLIINYAINNKIPHMKYETYDYLHNKAYQFDLLDNLNYGYIPSLMTSKLNKIILSKIKEFGYPLIVKDVFLDKGKGIFTINNQLELINKFKFNNKLLLIQKFIPNDGEYRVITIKNKVVLIAKKNAIEKVDKINIDARKSIKGELPTNVIYMCEEISKHLFSDIVGFDIIQDKNDGTYYVIETNASPHFSMFSVVTNVSVPDIITDYILNNMKISN